MFKTPVIFALAVVSSIGCVTTSSAANTMTKLPPTLRRQLILINVYGNIEVKYDELQYKLTPNVNDYSTPSIHTDTGWEGFPLEIKSYNIPLQLRNLEKNATAVRIKQTKGDRYRWGGDPMHTIWIPGNMTVVIGYDGDDAMIVQTF